MITLDQVRQLEARVKRAVDLIDTLREENSVLTGRLAKSEIRLKELEQLVDGFRNDQDLIEKGIRDVLEQLNSLEDGIYTEQLPEVSAPETIGGHTEDEPGLTGGLPSGQTVSAGPLTEDQPEVEPEEESQTGGEVLKEDAPGQLGIF